jgi:hypothetical protein
MFISPGNRVLPRIRSNRVHFTLSLNFIETRHRSIYWVNDHFNTPSGCLEPVLGRIVWLELSSAELAILHQLQGCNPSTPFLPQPTNQQVGYPWYESVHLWSKECHPDPLPIHPNSTPTSPQCASPAYVNHDGDAVKF